jgi:hypothetical protein
MHDDFQEFEAELKSLRPRAVSPKLMARLERELVSGIPSSGRSGYTTATTWRSWKWAVWPAAAAVAVALALAVLRPVPASAPIVGPVATSPATPAVTSPADFYKPVRADNVLYSTREEGGVTLADGTPARRVRSQYIDTITWKNPRTNASLSWSVPRDEVRIVPVSFQ